MASKIDFLSHMPLQNLIFFLAAMLKALTLSRDVAYQLLADANTVTGLTSPAC